MMRQSGPKGWGWQAKVAPQGWNLWVGNGRLTLSTDYSAHSLLPGTGATCLQSLFLPSRAAHRQLAGQPCVEAGVPEQFHTPQWHVGAPNCEVLWRGRGRTHSTVLPVTRPASLSA